MQRNHYPAGWHYSQQESFQADSSTKGTPVICMAIGRLGVAEKNSCKKRELSIRTGSNLTQAELIEEWHQQCDIY